MSRSIFEDRNNLLAKRRKTLLIIGVSVFTCVSIFVFFALNYYLMPPIKAFFVDLIRSIHTKTLFEFIFDEGRIPLSLLLILIESIFLYGILHCLKKLFRLKWPKKGLTKFDLDLARLKKIYGEVYSEKLSADTARAKRINDKCPKCGKDKVVEKISLMTGSIQSSFWTNVVKMDTKKVNSCISCGHQWFKQDANVEVADVLVEMFQEMHDFFSGVQSEDFEDPLRKVCAESVKQFLLSDYYYVKDNLISDLRDLPVKELRKYCAGR